MKLQLDPATKRLLKNPAVQLSAAAAAGLMLLVLAVLLFILPQRVQLNAARQEVSDLLMQAEQMEKLPIPSKVTDAEVKALLEQVPTREETARLIRLLQTAADEAKVDLSAVTFGELQTNPQSNLEQLLTRASDAQQVSGTSIASAPASSSPAPAAASANAGASPVKLPFEESGLDIEIRGYYSQTMEFLALLQQQPRLIRVKEWSLTAGGTGEAAAAAAANPAESAGSAGTPTRNGELPVVLKLKLAAYSASSYGGKLQDLPAPAVSLGAGRKDPTLSDAVMWEMLQQPVPASSPSRANP